MFDITVAMKEYAPYAGSDPTSSPFYHFYHSLSYSDLAGLSTSFSDNFGRLAPPGGCAGGSGLEIPPDDFDTARDGNAKPDPMSPREVGEPTFPHR